MQRKVHLAFPIDDEDESGEKSIDKAQEALTRLKTVRQTLTAEIKLGRSLYLQTDSGDQKSVRGAQLLLSGAILQQYCAAGEEEDDESEDGVDVIDVKHLTLLVDSPVYEFSL